MSAPTPVAPSAAEAKALLDDLAATTRGAGTALERSARGHCASWLAAAGFTTREAPFAYSAFPGRWATPLAGLMVLGVVAAGGHFGHRGSPGVALLLVVGGLATIGAFAWWSTLHGVLWAPWLRCEGVNLEATRGATVPRVWLVAHVDSKSQPVPIGVRAGAIMLAAVACLLLVAAAVAALSGAAWAGAGRGAWIAATLLGVAGALPIVATTVGDRSPGALDNASGVATILLAVAAMPADVPVGVLVTSAEELGLAGARAWALSAEPAVAINCDGVDDRGGLTVMRARRGEVVSAALGDAARAEGLDVRIRGLIPGVLVDAVALADAGWRTATVSRGDVRSLLRIHAATDSSDRIDGTGIAEAARVIARAATALARSTDA